MEMIKKIAGIFLYSILGFIMGTPFVIGWLFRFLNLFIEIKGDSELFGLMYYYGFPLIGLILGITVGIIRVRK